MKKWEFVPLGRVASVTRDVINPSHVDAETAYVGLENVLRGGALVNVRSVGETDLSSAKFRFTDRHVLFGKLRPYLAKIARPDFAGVCSTDILPILPNSELDRGYLAHFLAKPATVELANSRATGANLPRLSPTELQKFQLPLPPLEEQRRIAEMLDRADELRARRREALAHLDDLTQSIFLDMFGNPARNHELWPSKTIGDLLDSATYGSSEKASLSGDLPVLRMNNLTKNGQIDLTNLKYLDSNSTADRYRVRAGDVLFNRTNSVDLVGKAAIYRGSESIAYAGYLIRLRVNAENNPEYLAAFLNTAYAKRVLRGMCKSIIGMANINAKELQSIRVAQPPLGLQNDFAARLRDLEGERDAHRRSLTELDALFASLQDRAFRGLL